MSVENWLRAANHKQPGAQTVLLLKVFYVCSGQSLLPKELFTERIIQQLLLFKTAMILSNEINPRTMGFNLDSCKCATNLEGIRKS